MSREPRSWSESFLGAALAVLLGCVALSVAVDILKAALPLLAVAAGVFLVWAVAWRVWRNHSDW